jgi:hypothetical protein
MPAAVPIASMDDAEECADDGVMIGIDPHKDSHTGVAIDAGEVPLGRVWIRACPDQAGQLLAWVLAWPGSSGAKPRTVSTPATSPT